MAVAVDAIMDVIAKSATNATKWAISLASARRTPTGVTDATVSIHFALNPIQLDL